MAFCSTCGAQIADGTTTCAACAGTGRGRPSSASRHRRRHGRQRCRHAGLCHHHPSHHFPGDGTVQQEPLRSLSLLFSACFLPWRWIVL